ncbi:ABC transporter permease [Streptomyces sp. CAU 1734]|uniref:ABC transporter permease n=1 Tax=Streptomyces sp. CAU 1734 TaxID=3140360 RepID=UPI00326181DD
MSAGTTGTASGTRTREDSHRAWPAVRALAAAEAYRLLRHPLILGTLVVCSGLWIHETALSPVVHYPVLQYEDRALQLQLLLPAAGVFLAAHRAVLRPVRDGTGAWFDTLAVEPWQRAAALLLALLPVTGLVTLTAGARTLWLVLLPESVGSPSPAELATGPAAVLLAGVLAVLTGTLSRSPAMGPLVLGAAGIVTVAAQINPSPSASLRWLMVVVIDEGHQGLPARLLGRPAALHLLYLVLLAAVLGTAVLLLSGARGPGVRIAAALALAGTVAAGAAQLRPLSPSVAEARTRVEHFPSPGQRCVREGRVTYCAFPEFLDRHRQWSGVAERILSRVPERVLREGYTVRQRIAPLTGPGVVLDVPPLLEAWAADDRRAGTPGAAVVGTEWGVGSDGASDAVGGFASEFAHRVITAGPSGGSAEAGAMPLICGGRGVVAVWLAAQATPETRTALRSTLGRSSGDGVGFGGVLATVDFGREEAEAAMRLLDLPGDGVAERVARHWDELTAAGTTLPRAAGLLGGSAREPAARHADSEARCAR